LNNIRKFVVRASSLLTFVSGSLKFVIYDAKLIADSSLLVMMNGRTTLEGKTVMEERSNQLSTLLSLFADLEVHSRRPRLILNLPNLFVNQINFVFVGNDIEITGRIGNSGPRDSGPFNVMTILTRSGQNIAPISLTRIDNLPAHTAQDVSLTTLRDSSQYAGEQICATVLVDPPTAEQAWGEVIETTVEDNNLRNCMIVPPITPVEPPPENGEISDEDLR
jgi:hypothetical protein